MVEGAKPKPGVDSRDEGKHTGGNDLLFADGRASVTKDEERVLRVG